jgi:hypothetical protein
MIWQTHPCMKITVSSSWCHAIWYKHNDTPKKPATSSIRVHLLPLMIASRFCEIPHTLLPDWMVSQTSWQHSSQLQQWEPWILHMYAWLKYSLFNPFAYTYGWEPVWATDVFAFSSSFLSVDGMTCHIYRFKAGGGGESIFRMVYQNFDCIDFWL